MEKLKKNGSFKTVSTNLNNLSGALKNLPNVHNAANALRTLANSVEKLKEVGTVSTLTNSLNKLPAALKSVSNINLDKIAPQIQKVADTVAPLSSIKAGGLSTMVNSMKKLGEVTESLDDDTIARFAEKVELLNAKLAPLSAKMSTIKTGFNAINTSARKASESVEDFGDGINASALNMTSFIEIARTVVDALSTIIQKLSEFIHQAAQWDGVKYQFGNAFGEQADMYYEKISKITEALNINKQAFMENSAMAASMLIGFGVDKQDAREMGLGYTQLAYDIWAAYNNVYESLDGADGAMAAIRSAIAGEVEPIRRAGFTIVEATLEQTAANHGLDISLANATEAQKSYLRYLELVDQAHRKGVVGTYAREMETAEGMMRTFSQQLKSLAQAFGSLFLPILVKVMPYVQAFVEILKEGVFWLASLFGIEIQDIGDTWSDFSSSVGSGAGALDGVADSAGGVTDSINDATKAAKELKNATLGIDELNVISPNTSTGSSGSGGGSGGSGGGAGGGFEGLDIDSLWDDSIFDGIQQDVDKIKGKLKDWLPVIAGVATALSGLRLSKLLEDVELAGFKLKNLGKVVSVAGIVLAVGKLVWDFTGAYLEGGDEADLLKAIGSTVLGTALAYWMAGKPGASFTLLASGVVTLTKLGIEIGEGTVEWNDTESLVTAGVGLIETVIGGFFTWKTIQPILKEAWPKIAEKATPVLSKAGPYGWLAAAVVAGIVLAIVDYDFTEVGEKVGEKVGEGIKLAFENLTPLGLSIKFGKWLMKELDVDTVWDLIKAFFKPETWTDKIFPEVEKVFTNVSDWINDKIENFRGNINEFFDGFFDGLLDSLGIDMSWADKFGEVFDIEYMDIVDAVLDPSSIGKKIMENIVEAMDKNGIKDKLSDAWNNAKTWWDTKKESLGSYTPSIGSISSKLSTAWSTAKSWWDKKKSGLKTYTPSIGSIYDKLKPRWDNARTWWNNKKSAMKTYTPSIGSIYEKVADRWRNARDWWNKKKGSFKTYTPSIGSLTDKLRSAWNSAKNWWNKNVKLNTKLNVQVPTIKVKWDTASAFGKSFKYPTGFSLKFAADGGIFDAGSLIWAGERGPEIVANASGGKTGVMNVQQMQDAVYEGVYAAVVAAMRGNSGGEGSSQVIRVYLDGKEVASSVEKAQRERGASLMGNEVYSY